MKKRVTVVYKSGDAKLDNSIYALSRKIHSVKDKLRKEGVDVEIRWMSREKMNIAELHGLDLILVAGGDGTFLSTSHLITDKTPVIGVNTDTEKSVGFYLKSDLKNIKKDLELILTSKSGEGYYLHSLPRLLATIHTQSRNIINTDLALNDLLISNTVAYYPSKYFIRYNGKKDYQTSSGIIVFTSAGYSGWAKNVLRKEIRMKEDEFGFVVREPMNAKYVKGILKKDKELIIESDMHRGFVVPDSYDEYHFGRGAKIRIRLVEKSLNVVSFSKNFLENRREA